MKCGIVCMRWFIDLCERFVGKLINDIICDICDIFKIFYVIVKEEEGLWVLNSLNYKRNM